MGADYLFATEEQKRMVEEVHEICEKTLNWDIVKKAEAEGTGYPWEAHHALANAGYYSMSLPEEWGGRNLPFVTRGMIFEEISKYDLGFAFSFRGIGEKFGVIINNHTSRDEKEAWIARQMGPEHIGGTYCLTEPAAGSDAKGIQTTAYKDGDEWVINGEKRFITNANNGSYYNVVAWTDKTVSAGKGISAIMVPAGTPGITHGKEEAMGLALCDYGWVKFDNVRVPITHTMGEEGKAFSSSMNLLAGVRPYNVCFAVGAAQRAIDIAVDFANNREGFGKHVINQQAVSFELAELQMKVDCARAMGYYALKAADDGIPLGRAGTSAKGMGIKMCVEVCTDLIELMGAYGYSNDYPIQKIARDIRGYAIAGGTYNIMREIIARTMTKKENVIK